MRFKCTRDGHLDLRACLLLDLFLQKNQRRDDVGAISINDQCELALQRRSQHVMSIETVRRYVRLPHP